MRDRRAEAANVAPEKIAEWSGGLADDLDSEIVELRTEVRAGFGELRQSLTEARTEARLDNQALRSRVTSVLVAIIVATLTISGSLIAVLITAK